MKKKKYILVLIILTILITGIFVTASIIHSNSQDKEFDRQLIQLSVASNSIQKIHSFQSIENLGGGWFSLNGNEFNPVTKVYYLSKPVTVSEFASSTGLSELQVNQLTVLLNNYPYISKIENDVNINGTCTDTNNKSLECNAIKFYLDPIFSFYSYHEDGYIYIPFHLTENDKDYLYKYFSGVDNVNSNWYEFHGEHY